MLHSTAQALRDEHSQEDEEALDRVAGLHEGVQGERAQARVPGVIIMGADAAVRRR